MEAASPDDRCMGSGGEKGVLKGEFNARNTIAGEQGLIDDPGREETTALKGDEERARPARKERSFLNC